MRHHPGLVRAATVASAVLALVASATTAAAQQIPRVGIVDLQRVTITYFRESAGLRSFEDERDRVQRERARLEVEIFDLEARKVAAEQAENSAQALRIDEQLFNKRQHLRNYLTVKSRQLAEMVGRLAESDEFLTEMTTAIEFVAESEGYSIILNKDNDLFLFFVPEVDITDLVIAELASRAAR